MIEANPKSLFSGDFYLCTRNRLITRLDLSSWRERAEFVVDGVHCHLHRETLLRGAFVLEAEGNVLARAEKRSAFRDRFELKLSGRLFGLRRLSIWTRRFGLFEGERQIGEIRAAGLFTRRALIDLPSDWPAAVQCFVFWLVLVLWNRDATAAAS